MKKKNRGFLGIIFACVLAMSVPFVACASKNTKSDTKTNEQSGLEASAVIDTEKVEAENVNHRGYDVVYVIDNSGSISAKNQFVQERNKAFCDITNMAAGSDIRIGVVYFGDHVNNQDVLALTSVKDLDQFASSDKGCGKVLGFLDKKRDKSNNDTNIGEGLKKAYSLFDDSNRKKIVVLFSDGKDDNNLSDPSEETKKQAKLLGEKEIPIYCVYLQNGENDEKELKKIVNYYGDEKYAEERFSSTNKPAELSDLFCKVFYGMQQNMQYHQVSLDAYGLDNFYVPSLGVSKIRICMNLPEKVQMKVNSAESCEGNTWSNSYAKMAVYEDPSAGDWSVEVTDDSAKDAYGTIVYDVDVQMNLSLEPVKGNENEYKLYVHLYDKNGKEIAIDDAANISVNFDQNGDSADTEALRMKVADGKAYCEEVSLEADKSYKCKVKVQYSEFVNLQYSISDFQISKTDGGNSDEDSSGTSSDSSTGADANKKSNNKGLILLIGLVGIAVIVVLFVLRNSKRKKNRQKKLDGMIDEFRKLLEEMDLAYQLCYQELVTAKKLKEKAERDGNFRARYDFSRLDQLKADFLSKESEIREVKSRWELIKRQRSAQDADMQNLTNLITQVRKITKELESVLTETRTENKKLQG